MHGSTKLRLPRVAHLERCPYRKLEHMGYPYLIVWAISRKKNKTNIMYIEVGQYNCNTVLGDGCKSLVEAALWGMALWPHQAI